jgi:hypothetical protein
MRAMQVFYHQDTLLAHHQENVDHNHNGAQRQWLTPIMLGTQEAEMGRITVQGQPRQKSLQDHYLNGKKAGLGGMHLSPQ